MQEIVKCAAEFMPLENALQYYYMLGISTAVNDGKDLFLEIEKPLAGKHEGQK